MVATTSRALFSPARCWRNMLKIKENQPPMNKMFKAKCLDGSRWFQIVFVFFFQPLIHAFYNPPRRCWTAQVHCWGNGQALQEQGWYKRDPHCAGNVNSRAINEGAWSDCSRSHHSPGRVWLLFHQHVCGQVPHGVRTRLALRPQELHSFGQCRGWPPWALKLWGCEQFHWVRCELKLLPSKILREDFRILAFMNPNSFHPIKQQLQPFDLRRKTGLLGGYWTFKGPLRNLDCEVTSWKRAIWRFGGGRVTLLRKKTAGTPTMEVWFRCFSFFNWDDVYVPMLVFTGFFV